LKNVCKEKDPLEIKKYVEKLKLARVGTQWFTISTAEDVSASQKRELFEHFPIL